MFSIYLAVSGLILVSVFTLYLHARNCHVFNVRMRTLRDQSRTAEESIFRLNLLPSYDEMIWDLFRWDGTGETIWMKPL